MDLNFSSTDLAFREEVASYLKEVLPETLRNKVRASKHMTKQDHETWHQILAKKGWLAGNWPKRYGGQDWGPVQSHILEEEAVRAGAPRIIPFGIMMLGPLLIKFGSEEQKAHYLPRILDGTDWWCQGYSEPGAGSDLASLKTKAVREGDYYLVNGQKTWTTLAQRANWIFCLVKTKTDGKPQEGITFLLIDMATPGVEVRPIVTLDGGREVNEVFLTDVKVPVSNRVGEENLGWTYAKYLLSHERANIAGVAMSMQALDNLRAIAQDQKKAGRPLSEDPVFSAKITALAFDLDAMRTTNLRMLAAAQAGDSPGPESSMLKIKGSLIRQQINDLTRQALGPNALPFISEAQDEGSNIGSIGPDYANPVASRYFNNRKMSIYGGSNEIQRNIIAKTMMGDS